MELTSETDQSYNIMISFSYRVLLDVTDEHILLHIKGGGNTIHRNDSDGQNESDAF